MAYHRNQDGAAHYRASSPHSPRPVRISNHHRPGSSSSTLSLDHHVGDFVTRNLLPTMLGSSARPMKVIMNFGHLTVEDDIEASHYYGGHRASSPNAIIYNAPGGSLALDKADPGRWVSGARRVAAAELVPVSGSRRYGGRRVSVEREREYLGGGRRYWDAVKHIAPPSHTGHNWWRRDWAGGEGRGRRERGRDWGRGRKYYSSDSEVW
ncbi:hypothetical protein B0H67DRAFT_663687 [Lasiosphaeris hirsuta]|uniref:Uncharacterized protein n=1 Tax=Lasiosphaeris hirsuta TaxID=260670 RepID=A0AA40AS78_9PEZI|nr:hypothetical protein B0H67DRAFT_663687 [Lasiosphaeris hirsuta]